MENCMFCGEGGNIERHHIIPKRYGGSDSDGNLIPVCQSCHQTLESVYDDDFFVSLNTAKGRYPPEFPDRVTEVWFNVAEREPSPCYKCERYGPFKYKTKQPGGGLMLECCRCGSFYVQNTDLEEGESRTIVV